MKKSVFFIFFFIIINSYGYSVRLFFTNNTPDRFRPLAVINYDQGGVFYEKYIEPEIPVIEAYAQHLRIDKDRVGITHYFLLWFELNDEQNHYKDACLDSYVAISRSSDIHFILSRDEEEPYQYHCKYKIIPRHAL